MYSRHFAEMFPSEDLHTMWCCVNPQCFYLDALFKPTEVDWREKWCHIAFDLVPIPLCPSCR